MLDDKTEAKLAHFLAKEAKQEQQLLESLLNDGEREQAVIAQMLAREPKPKLDTVPNK